SRSACRTQFRSVSPEQPIFSAIDWMAAHCEEYSLSCSNTIRTARSRTSGEYFFALVMTPISQRLEPPANPGRFTNAPGIHDTRPHRAAPSRASREYFVALVRPPGSQASAPPATPGRVANAPGMPDTRPPKCEGGALALGRARDRQSGWTTHKGACPAGQGRK